MTGERGLIDGIDKLESMIAAFAANDHIEGHVEQRLRSFGSKLHAWLAGIEAWDTQDHANADLVTASDDELFEALNNELDSSNSADSAPHDGRA